MPPNRCSWGITDIKKKETSLKKLHPVSQLYEVIQYGIKNNLMRIFRLPAVPYAQSTKQIINPKCGYSLWSFQIRISARSFRPVKCPSCLIMRQSKPLFPTPFHKTRVSHVKFPATGTNGFIPLRHKLPQHVRLTGPIL